MFLFGSWIRYEVISVFSIAPVGGVISQFVRHVYAKHNLIRYEN